MLIIITTIIILIRVILKLIIYLLTKKYGLISFRNFSAAGFNYDHKNDIFYSNINAWQKNFGYTRVYDVLAPFGQIILDTEPITFNYNDQNYLLTFWKGQYGIATGAEVGIYKTKDQMINKNTLYLPIDDNEILDISVILYKNGKVITKKVSRHWWLAVFKVGMYSNPEELEADINITFPNIKMLISFLVSFQKIGYKSTDYTIVDRTFCFKFKKPHSKKVWSRNYLSDKLRQRLNRKSVELYNRYLADIIQTTKINESNLKQNYILVNDLIPDFFKNSTLGKNNTLIKSTSKKTTLTTYKDNNLKKGDYE